MSLGIFAGLEIALPGNLLKNRWLVGEFRTPSSTSTGGCFSLQFACTDTTTGGPVFLKVVDINNAIGIYTAQGMNMADVLIKLGEEHKFESNLMEETKNLRRVVVALDSGSVSVPGFSGPVMFLVFEIAESGDTHKVKAEKIVHMQRVASDRWWLETLHCVATGLNQLHALAIAHQDVKPSNLLFFQNFQAKIADLGRAVKKGQPSTNLTKNGDPNHSPPEIFYSHRAADWGVRYLAVDLYMLGNLIYYHFCDIPITVALMSRLDPAFNPWLNPGVSFTDALPALQEAFGRLLVDFRENELTHLPEKAADELTTILGQLCEPYPEKRGHPRDHAQKHGPKFSTMRYIGKLQAIRNQI